MFTKQSRKLSANRSLRLYDLLAMFSVFINSLLNSNFWIKRGFLRLTFSPLAHYVFSFRSHHGSQTCKDCNRFVFASDPHPICLLHNSTCSVDFQYDHSACEFCSPIIKSIRGHDWQLYVPNQKAPHPTSTKGRTGHQEPRSPQCLNRRELFCSSTFRGRVSSHSSSECI